MDFLGGALPNVMFIVGVLAVGLGLGIELKLVPLNKEIGRFGRVGAFVFGLALIGASLAIYLNPSLMARGPQPAAVANAALPAQVALQPTATLAATAVPPTTVPPTAVRPTTAPATTVPPTAVPPTIAPPTPAPATAVPPTIAPPTAVRPTTAPATTAPAQVAAAQVKVPDLRGMDDKGAQRALAQARLKAQKVAKCTGTNPGDPKTRKGRVQCQNPGAGQPATIGSTVEYMLAGS